MKTKKAVFLALALLVVLAALPWQGALAAGTRYYVKQGGDDSKDGLSWENAKANLKAVMDVAGFGDEIWVAKGTYSPGGDPADTFNLKRGVKVYGGFEGNEGSPNERDLSNAANKTTLDGGGNVYHVVTGGTAATPTNTRLDGFTITGGNASGFNEDAFGGGMYNVNSSPTVANCVFSGNTAGYGGGMYNIYNSSPAVTDCVFSGNTAGYGGGMCNYYNSSPTVANCAFSGNTANDDGGGMYNDNSSPRVEACTFITNTAGYGGGMYNIHNSSPAVENCVFSGNTAEGGGGMYNDISSPAVKNCSFSGNTAEGGGGMHNFNSSPAVVNCTFSGNTADDLGGGMYNNNSSPAVVNCTFSKNTGFQGGGMYNDNSSPILANTILWGNTAPSNDDGPDIYQDGGNFILKECVVDKYKLSGATEDTNNSIITTNPNLQPLDKDGNAELDPAKVYIYGLGNNIAKNEGLNVGEDVGNGITVPDTDQRGVPRRTGDNAVDIGAYEDEAHYTVAFDANGGSGYMRDAKVLAGQEFTFPPNGFEPPTGKEFDIWAIGNVNSNDKAAPGAKRTFATGSRTTVYALWKTPVTGVSLNKTITALTVGGNETLQATITPSNATNQNVDWSSDNDAVATVNTNGKVTGVARGKATITVTTQEGGFRATCTVFVRATGQNIWYVTQTGAGKKDGTSWLNASPDLKEIMTIAQSGDEIWVAKGTYSPGGDVTDTFLLKQDLKVYGGFAGDETSLNQRVLSDSNKTILDGGGNVYHVVTGETGATADKTRLDGFTITGGNANGSIDDGAGGGMFNWGSSPTVANSTFFNNQAKYGGGMYNYNSTPEVTNCFFSGNTADDGGGMYNNNANPAVENCTFSGNTADDGGGMYNSDSNPAVTNCVFSGNTADAGGGMHNDTNIASVPSTPRVENCVFSGNTAGVGGGMYNSNSSPAVKNCAFSGNTAASYGGGMNNSHHVPGVQGNPRVENCTFSGNTANQNGGGMFNWGSSPATVVNCTFSGNTANLNGGGMYNTNASPTLANTILWGNTAPADSGPDIYQNGSTLTLKNCVVGKYTLNGATISGTPITGDPKLNGYTANLEATGDPKQVYIYKLGSGSSAIDKGLDVGTHNGITVPGTDQLGTARPKGAGVDIGAFEAVVCTVTYDKNGGGGEDMTPGAAVVGVPFELPACTFTPLTGKQFNAWAIGSVSGTPVSAGNTYTFDVDTTVFALWEVADYQVKVNNGTSIPAGTAAYNATVTITANPPVGQQFKNWTIVSGNPALADASAATTTFTMPANDVEVTANFENIPVTGVTLDRTALTLTVGGAATLTAAVEPADAANQNVTWSSDKPAIAAVDNGVVTAVSVGTATITVTTVEGSHQATCTVTVNPVAVTGVMLDQATLNLTAGGATGTLTATVLPADATNKNVTWASSNEAVATVANGVVTPKAAGQAIITVKTDDGNKTATCTVTVSATAVPVTGVKLNKTATALVVGGTETLFATIEPSTATNRNVTWSSDKPAIATVDNSGKVTAVGVGQATITVKTDDGNKTAACTVTVSATAVPVTGVKLNKASTVLVVGGTETLVATVEPATATNRNVTWGSDKLAVATVDNGGKVTAVGVGQATITVKTDDGNKTAACTVTVSAVAVPVTGVKLNKASTVLVVGGTETLYATVEPATATNRNVTWSSDKPAVATVDAAGRVMAVGVGQATITVKTDDGNKTAACTVTVQSPGINYSPVSKDGQPDTSTHSYTRNGGSYLEIIIKRSVDDHKTFALFRQLMMDGALVSESHYTRAEGSLIVRLKSSWLDTLPAGLHTLRFIFEDGEAKATFTIQPKPGSFEDVAVPGDHFTFTKRWKGGTGNSIDWTLYDEMDYVAHKLFNKKVVSQTEWRYEAWFDRPVCRYVVEKPIPGYNTRYENVGVYAGITDRCCNGGTIINYKIPQTGDQANPALWAGLALLGMAGIVVVLMTGRRRKASK